MSQCHLVIVRHGATEFTEKGLLCGGSDPVDPPLSQQGLAQAEGAARVVGALRDGAISAIGRPVALYTSPVRRARELAAKLEPELGLKAQVAEPLREIGVGDRFGAVMDDLWQEFPALMQDWIKGEPLWDSLELCSDFARRVQGFVKDLVATHQDECVVLACHEVVTRVILAMVMDVETVTRLQIPLGNTAVITAGDDPTVWSTSLPPSLL